MLANGTILSYKKKGAAGNYKKLTGLMEIPEMGEEAEKVDVTTLEDTVKQYEFGIGDAGDLEYKFSYDNSDVDSPYRVMRNHAADKEILSFQEELTDGTQYVFDAMVSVKRGGGGVNGHMQWTLGIALKSSIETTDPHHEEEKNEI